MTSTTAKNTSEKSTTSVPAEVAWAVTAATVQTRLRELEALAAAAVMLATAKPQVLAEMQQAENDKKYQEALKEARAEARDEMRRVDAKAGILFTLSGVALTGSLAVITKGHLPVVAGLFAVVTMVMIGFAAAFLALAIRPNLRGSSGIIQWAKHGVVLLSIAEQEEALRWLASAVIRKHRHVRTAVDLLLCAGAGMVITASVVALANLA